jgi:hypothetical protein
LTRPIAMYVPILAAIVFSLILRRHLKRAAAATVLFTGIFICILLPWLIRNYHHFGRISLSTSRSLNMLVLQVAPIAMEQQHITLNDAQLDLLRDAEAWMMNDGKNPSQLSDFQKAVYWEKLARHMIRQQPFIFFKYYLYGIVQNFWGLGTALFAQTLHFSEIGESFDPRTCSDPIEVITQWILRKTLLQKYLGFLVALYLVITYVLAILGVKAAWHDSERVKVLFIVAVILYFILLTGSAVSVRFKLPIIPYYSIFTAIGLSKSLHYFKIHSQS